MHGRLCPKPEENGAVDSLEMPVPTASGGRTRRTGLLTVMERPPGKKKTTTQYRIFHSIHNFLRIIITTLHAKYTLSPTHSQSTPLIPTFVDFFPLYRSE